MLNVSRDRLEGVGRQLARVATILGVTYLLASCLSAWIMSVMMNSALASMKRPQAQVAHAATPNFGGSYNYRDLQKSIEERNLFNSTGEFPSESDPNQKGEGGKSSAFDINAPCSKPTVNVDLVGTIYMGETDSIATVQEKGYSESDVYRQGDFIVGNDDVQVVKIERNRVILNNKGVKECLELAAGPKLAQNDGFPSVAPAAGASPAPEAATKASGGETVLEEKYVQDELGPGFGTIIQKARLVPNTTDNVMNGFKIFAIDGNSLLAKVGLKNGDIITQVNDVSLKQPEQGFTLYQAFQDEREVRIHILRGGTTPMMLTSRIK